MKMPVWTEHTRNVVCLLDPEDQADRRLLELLQRATSVEIKKNIHSEGSVSHIGIEIHLPST